MDDTTTTDLKTLAAHLTPRRDAILQSWRQRSLADSVHQHTGGALTRAQFNDHIPQVLTAFEQKLNNPSDDALAAQVDEKLHDEEMKHGQQRWQQGYRLPELVREWGHLHLTIAEEIDGFAAVHPPWSRSAFAAAHRELLNLVNQGIGESVDQFARMERAEAAGRMQDLELAIAHLERLEQRRSQLIHQAVHDLRSDVQSVRNVAELLADPVIEDRERVEFAGMLQEGVDAVGTMLADLMDLARLEAGQEHRTIEPFDAGSLLLDLCRFARPSATARQLYLRTDGPKSLPVEGDARRVRRIVQNLVFNALKYTQQGGVVVSWDLDKNQWWVAVKDTGPGLMAGPGAPLALEIRNATAVAREADVKAAQKEGRTSAILDQQQTGTTAPAPSHQESGEGIGLSIVKRLCDLLDASLEMISSSESGTTLRVVFPATYRPPV